jgi:uncharacterized protein
VRNVTGHSDEKLAKVANALRNKDVLVAFSGGVDSSVLASIALEVGRRVVLLTIVSEVVPAEERERAKAIARELGGKHIIVDFDWLEEENLRKNPPERCYNCKALLATLWKKKAEELGIDLVVEGTTATETQGHRPGLRALRETGVSSPFLDAGVMKSDVRSYARSKGLSMAEAPSMACLATRFPYGTTITTELLRKIEVIESMARKIFGVECVRARLHDELIRIEVGQDEMNRLFDIKGLEQLDRFVKSQGFRYAALDLGGYRTGSMDET